MDTKTLVELTEERMSTLKFIEMMEALQSLEDNPLLRNELMTAIHNKTDLERIGRAFSDALYHYHSIDVDLNNNFGEI